MKKLIVILFMLISFIGYGQLNTAKLLTPTDSVLDVSCQQEILQISVYDASATDTIYVYTPISSDGSTTVYALIGKIMDLTNGEEVTLLIGESDNKVYQLWFPYPRAIRLVLSDYASGNVYVKTTGL